MRISESIPADKRRQHNAPEVWAGLECTINRVGDTYRDQLALAGHYERACDVERLVRLGVRCVRYPVLLERHLQQNDAWKITDAALDRLYRAGIEPIVGLMHHGSGAEGATLLDDNFPDTLAEFARVVAKRYPWVRKFTPVNEPLTTARFAALYGLWYPHQANDRAFVRALTNQILAVQQSMQAIRETIPEAMLVATEDLGYTHSVQGLKAQAQFENHRRWLTWDLLLGRMQQGHPLWKYLCACVNRRRLENVRENARREDGRPVIIGINHYLTSERYLDTELARYPEATHGGNAKARYADVEAVRVGDVTPLGIRSLLQQTWDRYQLPVAITEAHLSCTREQQLLWLNEVWQAASQARADGVDVRAVTAWAAFGSFDWNSLLTQNNGSYETGLYDLRAPEPRATALATMVQSLASTGSFSHPALAATPWWRHERRVLYSGQQPEARIVTEQSAARYHAGPAHSTRKPSSPLAITGSNGTLGRAFVRLAAERGLAVEWFGRDALDITNGAQVRQQLDRLRPWALINAAGWVRVDDAERHPDACYRVNACGAELLARTCADLGIQFVTFSSDLVFGGDVNKPCVESDATGPLNVYGHSKAEAERRVGACAPQSLIVRTSAFFGDWDAHNFVHQTLSGLANGQRVRAPSDAVVSPTYVTDLVHAVLDLLLDGEQGIWHLANRGAMCWLELAQTAATMAGLNKRNIERCRGADVGWIARRPAFSALASERGSVLPDIEHALARYIQSRSWAAF